MHYLDEGPEDAGASGGSPILMLHGNPTWSFYYRHLAMALRGQHRVIVPDQIGCGLSDKPDDRRYDYVLERRVEDLGALIDHLGIGNDLTLVLHDWGGMVGMGWAHQNPEKVARLVLLNTAAFPLPQSKPFPWPLALTRTPLGAFLVRRFNAFNATAIRVCCTKRRLTKEERAAYAAPYDSYDSRIATLRFVQDIPLSPADPGYSLVKEVGDQLGQFADTPTMIGWGLKDFVFDRHFLREWEKRMPHAEIHRYEDCGHFILEDAREEIIGLTKNFLRENPTNSEKSADSGA